MFSRLTKRSMAVLRPGGPKSPVSTCHAGVWAAVTAITKWSIAPGSPARGAFEASFLGKVSPSGWSTPPVAAVRTRAQERVEMSDQAGEMSTAHARRGLGNRYCRLPQVALFGKVRPDPVGRLNARRLM